MLQNLMLEVAKLFVKRDFCSVYKYFVYLFLAITSVWASIGSYHYFSEDWRRSFGAFLTAVICLAISMIIEAYYYFANRKKQTLPEPVSAMNSLMPLVIDALPQAWYITKGVYRYFGGFNWKGKLVVLGSIYMLLNLYRSLRK